MSRAREKASFFPLKIAKYKPEPRLFLSCFLSRYLTRFCADSQGCFIANRPTWRNHFVEEYYKCAKSFINYRLRLISSLVTINANQYMTLHTRLHSYKAPLFVGQNRVQIPLVYRAVRLIQQVDQLETGWLFTDIPKYAKIWNQASRS